MKFVGNVPELGDGLAADAVVVCVLDDAVCMLLVEPILFFL